MDNRGLFSFPAQDKPDDQTDSVPGCLKDNSEILKSASTPQSKGFSFPADIADRSSQETEPIVKGFSYTADKSVKKTPRNGFFVNYNYKPFGVNSIKGINISSSDMPPC